MSVLSFAHTAAASKPSESRLTAHRETWQMESSNNKEEEAQCSLYCSQPVNRMDFEEEEAIEDAFVALILKVLQTCEESKGQPERVCIFRLRALALQLDICMTVMSQMYSCHNRL